MVKLDKASIIGVILGLVAIFVGMAVKGAHLSALLNPAAFLIIILGTISAVVTAFPGSRIKVFPKLFKVIFTNNKNDLTHAEILKMFYTWASTARKSGLLALESELTEIKDEFIKRGLKMSIDGFSAHEIREMLEAEVEAIENRHSKNALIFTQAGTYAPTLGVLGAVIGLIAALGYLGDIDKLGHAIAGAFIATLLGIYTGYVLWHPFANKLKQKSAEEVEKKQLIIECIILIQGGVYPIMLEQRVLSSISESSRKKLAPLKNSGGEK